MLWLLSDLGTILDSIWNQWMVGHWNLWDFHQSFLDYKRKQVTNNYKSNLAITGIILQNCMCKKLNKLLPSPVCYIHCLLHFAFEVFLKKFRGPYISKPGGNYWLLLAINGKWGLLLAINGY